MTETSDLSLRVQTPNGWVEILSSTHDVTYRHPDADELEAGTLDATIYDVALDPSTSATLAKGQPIQLRTTVAGGAWANVWTGKLSTARVSYLRPGSTQPSKLAQIAVSAVDVVSTLNSISEPRSVHTLDGLRRLLTTAGVAYRINGTTATGPASLQVVALQDGATLGQQVALTRDAVLGYAWVAPDGVLEVRDPASIGTSVVATFTDQASPSYSTIDAAYDASDVLDEVSVEFLRYRPNAAATEPQTYGPYRRDGATGTNSVTVQLVSDVEDPAAIEAHARAVLARNAVAVTRPLSLTTPVKDVTGRQAAVAAHRCAVVQVTFADRVNAQVRVASIDSSITATNDGVRWSTTYTFDPPSAVQPSARRAVTAPAVLDRIETVETDLPAMVERVDAIQEHVDPRTGITITHGDSSESTIPFNDPSAPVVLSDADGTFRRLIAKGVAEFLDRVTFRRRGMVADGVSAPAIAPSVVASWPSVAVAGPLTPRALAPRYNDSTRWVSVFRSGDGQWALSTVLRATGAVSATPLAVFDADDCVGVTLIGSRYYVLTRGRFNPTGAPMSEAAWSVRVYDETGGLLDWWRAATTYRYRPTIGTDGTRVLVAFVDVQSRLRVRPYTTAGGEQNIVELATNVPLTDLAFIGNGTYNHGGVRLVVAPTDTNAMVWSGGLVSPSRQPTEDFPRAFGGLVSAIAWDGTRFHTLTGTRIAQHSAARSVAQSVQAAYDWAGLSSSSVIIETNVGPTTAAITIPAQTQILITGGTPPEANLTDPGVANRVAVYLAATGAALRRQGDPLPVGTRALSVDTVGTTGRTAGATGTFTSAAADLAPENPGQSAADSLRGWMLKGSGGGWIGGSATGINWSAAGIITLGSEAAAKIRALTPGPGTRPPGEMTAYAGPTAPDGWLLCDGTAVSRSTYAALFAVIGTTYGAGNGSSTFSLPDMRGRIPVGAGTNHARGSNEGATEADRSIRHRHGVTGVGNHSHSISGANITATTQNNTTTGGSAARLTALSGGNHDHGGSSGLAGAHDHGGTTGPGPLNGADAISHLGLNWLIKT